MIVIRRIGGLEREAKAVGLSYGVIRRIGGLEMDEKLYDGD